MPLALAVELEMPRSLDPSNRPPGLLASEPERPDAFGEAVPDEEPRRELVPLWGRHATLWQWLVVLGAVAVFGLLFHRITADAVAARGHDAIPEIVWRMYDWKIWPLNRFR